MTKENVANVAGLEKVIQRLNDLEAKLNILESQFRDHNHPYKPEPRYGGSHYNIASYPEGA